MLDLRAAEQILDFDVRIQSPQRAREQLEGAVAVHNLLERHRVAYLADEVGMGKTYVALGALALFRHYHPGFRALIIAPRENIQQKWIKDFRNFVAYNVRYPDLRVKNLDDSPTRRIAVCDDLVHLLREAALDPDADFFCRMTSFSLAVGGSGTPTPDDIKRLRSRLRSVLPWLDDAVFDLRSKQAFKENFARAVCCGLPTFDLVIIDEAHHLKHGVRESSAARNHVLALALGRDPAGADPELFPRYGLRARRVLFLSATPVEDDYTQLWNQLDVVGKSRGFDALKDRSATEEAKRETAGRFLIRRVTHLAAGDARLTKNQYRRFWRRGGVGKWDEPIRVVDPRQKLIVGLVQKKVSELLQTERFNSSFQIGMLASFESFLETAKVKSADDATNFDNPDQTDDDLEREGIDVRAINGLARSYQRTFGTELPHPKMDAVVEALSGAWRTGTKHLVFVRRVASVKELKRKLDERYDAWLIDRLRRELPQGAAARFERLVDEYREARTAMLAKSADLDGPSDDSADTGTAATFFGWYFRGDGPKNVVSGANVQQRFVQRGTVLSTFFEDNYVSAMLQCRPVATTATLAVTLGMTRDAVCAEINRRAAKFLPSREIGRGHRFEAAQAAAVEWLAETAGVHQHAAKVIWHARFHGIAPSSPAGQSEVVAEWLDTSTFFTELRARPALCAALWPTRSGESHGAFINREHRRQALATVARLGHAMIDFYVLFVRRLGTLQLRSRESADGDVSGMAVIDDYLDLLQSQMNTPLPQRSWGAFDELADLAQNFGLLLDLNFRDLLMRPLAESARLLGSLLQRQQPTGGMAGQVNKSLVGQFRMPGYPLVLISTDLLQEGEDLHTFCSSVLHYGVAWTPSALEQRIGRIDRVRSQTERRLASHTTGRVSGEDKLQVLFPYLDDTVEVLQVRRVLDRMDTFLRLMHEGLIQPRAESPRIELATEMQRAVASTDHVTDEAPLKSAYPVKRELLRGEVTKPAVKQIERHIERRLAALRETPLPGMQVDWESDAPKGRLYGTARLGRRIQPFVLIIDQFAGHFRLRCVSPVGRVDPWRSHEALQSLAWKTGARLGAVVVDREGSYDLTVEEDVLLSPDPAHDAGRLASMLLRVCRQADEVEFQRLQGADQAFAVFEDGLAKETPHGH